MEITDRRGEEIDPWRKGISTMTGSTDNRLECGVKRIIAKSKCYSVAWKVSVIRSSERYSLESRRKGFVGFRVHGNPGDAEESSQEFVREMSISRGA